MRLTRVTDCMFVGEDGNTYFCVKDFIRENQLPDTPEFRQVVIDEFKETTPDILILEELISEELSLEDQDLEEMN